MSREDTLLGLLTAYGGALRRIARTYAGARGEAEDLHQEILLQLWRGLASFRGDSAPGTSSAVGVRLHRTRKSYEDRYLKG